MNEIQEKLASLTDEELTKANQTYSLVRELKMELTFAYGGVVNHEIYFSHLGGKGGSPSGELLAQIKKDFGSFENYFIDYGVNRGSYIDAFFDNLDWMVVEENFQKVTANCQCEEC